jgi:hypothetical protein
MGGHSEFHQMTRKIVRKSVQGTDKECFLVEIVTCLQARDKENAHYHNT